MKRINKSYSDYWTSNSGNTSDENSSTKVKNVQLKLPDFEDSEDETDVDTNNIAEFEEIKLDSNNFEDTIKYRGEGNANIVIVLLESCQVVRLRKKHFSEVETSMISGGK